MSARNITSKIALFIERNLIEFECQQRHILFTLQNQYRMQFDVLVYVREQKETWTRFHAIETHVA